MISHESKSSKHTWRLALGHRKSLRGLAFGLVVLGFCVFGWGLRYKLSLYDPPHSVNHRMPAAKLLCSKECGDSVDVHLRPVSRTELPSTFSTIGLAFIFLAGSRLWLGQSTRQTALIRKRRIPSLIPRLAFSIRPPPSLH